MSVSLLVELMLFVTPFIVVIAYISSIKDTRKRFGSAYTNVVSEYQWKCLKGLALMVLYATLSCYQGGWQKLLGGVSFSASAFTFFSMAIYEMACAISLNHQFHLPKKMAQLGARIFIIGQTISLVSLILVFQSSTTHWLIVAFQIVLLLLSLIAFYLAGTMVNLIKVGYQPIVRQCG